MSTVNPPEMTSEALEAQRREDEACRSSNEYVERMRTALAMAKEAYGPRYQDIPPFRDTERWLEEIERLTRERDTWHSHYQDLLEDALSVRTEMARRDAERDRLRATLVELLALADISTPAPDMLPGVVQRAREALNGASSPAETSESLSNLGSPQRMKNEGSLEMPTGPVPEQLGESSAQILPSSDPSPSETSGWQPIETAPKDGRTLLLGYFNSHGKWRSLHGQWFEQDSMDEWNGADYGNPAGWYEISVENDDPPNCWATEPTHWQPTPRPPLKASGEPPQPYQRKCSRCGKMGPSTTPEGVGVYYCSIECAD